MILQVVEDTLETAGKFAKKLPAFRNTLIEVDATPTTDYTNGSQYAEQNTKCYRYLDNWRKREEKDKVMWLRKL